MFQKAFTSLFLVLSLGAVAAPAAQAGDAGTRRERLRERLQNLTPEQREKLKERIKEKLQNLTPEQRQKLKERLEERRANKK